jgi:hypothetical protein
LPSRADTAALDGHFLNLCGSGSSDDFLVRFLISGPRIGGSSALISHESRQRVVVRSGRRFPQPTGPIVLSRRSATACHLPQVVARYSRRTRRVIDTAGGAPDDAAGMPASDDTNLRHFKRRLTGAISMQPVLRVVAIDDRDWIKPKLGETDRWPRATAGCRLAAGLLRQQHRAMVQPVTRDRAHQPRPVRALRPGCSTGCTTGAVGRRSLPHCCRTCVNASSSNRTAAVRSGCLVERTPILNRTWLRRGHLAAVHAGSLPWRCTTSGSSRRDVRSDGQCSIAPERSAIAVTL